MLEKIVVGGFFALISIIMGFFWNKQSSQDASIKDAHNSIKGVQKRITDQSESNNDKFARRDDMKDMEERIIKQFKDGFIDLKKDIRALGKE